MNNNDAKILPNDEANSREIAELIVYNQQHFNPSQMTPHLTFPLLKNH